VDCRGEDVTPIAKDGEEQGRSKSMAQEGGEAHPQGGEPSHRHKSRLGLGHLFGKMRGGRDWRSEPEPKPPELALGVENQPVQVDGGY